MASSTTANGSKSDSLSALAATGPDNLLEELVETETTQDYLQRKIFPTLLPAIEALLKAVKKRDPMMQNPTSEIQPILWLAHYLYRHNPKLIAAGTGSSGGGGSNTLTNRPTNNLHEQMLAELVPFVSNRATGPSRSKTPNSMTTNNLSKCGSSMLLAANDLEVVTKLSMNPNSNPLRNHQGHSAALQAYGGASLQTRSSHTSLRDQTARNESFLMGSQEVSSSLLKKSSSRSTSVLNNLSRVDDISTNLNLKHGSPNRLPGSSLVSNNSLKQSTNFSSSFGL